MIAHAREDALTLMAETESLNEQLAQAEVKLESLNLGVFASVPLKSDAGAMVLSFKKKQGAWGLYVTLPNGDEQGLAHASRWTRILAAHALEDLRAALVEQVAIDLSNVRTARERVTAFLRS